MSEGAGPNKKNKTYRFHMKWEEDFFHVCLICQSAITKEGQCEVAFPDCSRKLPHRIPAVKHRERERGGIDSDLK